MLETNFPPYGEFPSLEIVVKTENKSCLKPWEVDKSISTVTIWLLNDSKVMAEVCFLSKEGVKHCTQVFEERVKNWPKFVKELAMASGVEAADYRDFVDELNLFLKDNTSDEVYSYLNFP